MRRANLSQQNLALLKSGVMCSDYDRAATTAGIVHLGVGNFHRGHQAKYCDDALSAGEDSWAIAGVSLRSSTARDSLAPQDFLFSITERNGSSDSTRIIGALQTVLVAPEQPNGVLELLAQPTTRIVSLTITEQGYAWPTEKLPIWRHDEFASQPAPALLFLCEALWRRWQSGTPLFTVLSCDNLAGNGKVLKTQLVSLAQSRDQAFARYLDAHLCSPSSMVDRIVPKTTECDISLVANHIGLNDAAAIVTEPFCQWIIEDNFSQGRPDLETYGAKLVKDVQPYEEMKLRLLNGAHTLIALFGQVTDMSTVMAVVGETAVLRFLEIYWKQTSTTLDIDYDLVAYRAQLLNRFANPSLRHQTAQIATDTSQKIGQRVAAPLLQLANRGQETKLHSYIIALWMRSLSDASEAGHPIKIDDPLGDRLSKIARSGQVERFLRQSQAFAEGVVSNSAVVLEIASLLANIKQHGASAVMEDLTNQYEMESAQ